MRLNIARTFIGIIIIVLLSGVFCIALLLYDWLNRGDVHRAEFIYRWSEAFRECHNLAEVEQLELPPFQGKVVVRRFGDNSWVAGVTTEISDGLNYHVVVPYDSNGNSFFSKNSLEMLSGYQILKIRINSIEASSLQEFHAQAMAKLHLQSISNEKL